MMQRVVVISYRSFGTAYRSHPQELRIEIRDSTVFNTCNKMCLEACGFMLNSHGFEVIAVVLNEYGQNICFIHRPNRRQVRAMPHVFPGNDRNVPAASQHQPGHCGHGEQHNDRADMWGRSAKHVTSLCARQFQHLY